MNRRRFLALLGAVVAAPFIPKVELAPEVIPPPAPVPSPPEPYGLHYWQVNAFGGTYAGIDRSAYPGRLSTPTLYTSGVALTPSVIRVHLKRVERAML